MNMCKTFLLVQNKYPATCLICQTFEKKNNWYIDTCNQKEQVDFAHFYESKL